MSKKALFTLLSVLAVASMVLAACGATPTVTVEQYDPSVGVPETPANLLIETVDPSVGAPETPAPLNVETAAPVQAEKLADVNIAHASCPNNLPIVGDTYTFRSLKGGHLSAIDNTTGQSFFIEKGSLTTQVVGFSAGIVTIILDGKYVDLIGVTCE